MKSFVCISILLVTLWPSFVKAQADRAYNIPTNSGEPVKVLYNKSHALIIGVSDYEDHWKDLTGVEEDIKAVEFELKKNGFNTKVLKNPTSKKLKDEFRDFIYTYGQERDSRILFYIAGHGETIHLAYDNIRGLFIPADAPSKNKKAEFMKKAIDMQWFKLHANHIQAKHVLFLFDSCFSGSFFKYRGDSEGVTNKLDNPVRRVITSGKADERVPDQSIFREQFIEALRGKADTDNEDGYLTGKELKDYLKKKVEELSNGKQHPQDGIIPIGGKDGGDFVFNIKKSTKLPISISSIHKEIRNKWDNIKGKKSIDCDNLFKYIANFKAKRAAHLREAAKSFEDFKMIESIDEYISKLIDRLNKCKNSFIDCECK